MFQFLKNTIFLLTFIPFCTMSVSAQDTIKGRVFDEITGQPVGFVNVSVQYRTLGCVTDSSGYFKLILDLRREKKIICSHINYKKKEIVLSDSVISSPLYIMLTPKTEMLDNVVVSASHYEQPLDKLAQPADIISHNSVLNGINSNMIDLLNEVPGFSQIWEYHSPVLLRGLNSKRIVFMEDGNRRIGTFPGGYFGQDMNIYDNNRIEIIKGPGSVIYGNGAISGIINVISKDPFGYNLSKLQVRSAYGSNNDEFLEGLRYCFKREKAGITIDGKWRKTGNYVYGNGETADNTNVEDRDISVKTGVKLSKKQKIIIKGSYHYGDWGKPRGFNGTSKRFTQIRNEEGNFHSSLNYTYTSGTFLENIFFSIYYNDEKRDYYKYKYSEITGDTSSLDLVHYTCNYGGSRLYGLFNVSASNKLTLGADGYIFMLDNPGEIFDYYYDTHGTTVGYIDAGQKNIGGYVNDEWELSDKIRFISGVRYDITAVYEGETSEGSGRTEERSAWSGNIGIVFSPGKNTNISFNLGRAFRMPSAEEMFTETVSCKGTKIGNPELNPEFSRNIDLGIRGCIFNKKIKYDISCFYNLLEDYICETVADDNEDADFTYKNTDARVTGGEASFTYCINSVFKQIDKLYITLNSAYSYGVDLSVSNTEPLFGIPPYKLNSIFDYKSQINKKFISGYSLKLTAEYAAPQNRVASVPEGSDGGPWGYETSDAHLVFNFSAGLNSNTLPGKPKLRVAVKNIFDTDYNPFGSYIPAMGRNIKILLSFTI